MTIVIALVIALVIGGLVLPITWGITEVLIGGSARTSHKLGVAWLVGALGTLVGIAILAAVI